jgi:hypothetical protein
MPSMRGRRKTARKDELMESMLKRLASKVADVAHRDLIVDVVAG